MSSEGFNTEISMVSEYKCIRCFISKNIVGKRESFHLWERTFLCSVHTRDDPSPRALHTLLEPHFLTLF